MKIYLDATQGLDSVKEYLLDMFSEQANYYDPEFKKCKPTFYDAELVTNQCKPARRSFEDILNIIHTNYDEKCTEKDLAKALHKLWLKDKFRGIYCPDVEKIVFFSYKPSFDYRFKMVGGYSIRHHGLDYKGKGDYSLREILDLAGCKNDYRVK